MSQDFTSPVIYDIHIKGETNLIMHADNVPMADKIASFRKNDKRKGVPKGDDRWPTWTWKSYLHLNENGDVSFPSSYVMGAIRTAAKKLNNRGEGLTATSQSVLACPIDSFPLYVCGKVITKKVIDSIKDPNNIDEFEEEVVAPARKHGIIIDIQRLTLGTSKHVRVRPRFMDWDVKFQIINTEPARLTKKRVVELINYAVAYCGFGDWRPSAPKCPGSHGKARIVSFEEKAFSLSDF